MARHAGEHVQRGGGGSVPVHAVVLKESVVLNGHGRLPQRVRDLFIVHPDAVFRAVDSLVFHPISGVPVLVIDDGAEIHGVVVGVDLQRRGQRGPDVHHKKPGKHRHCADAHQQHRPQDEDDLVARSFWCFSAVWVPGGGSSHGIASRLLRSNAEHLLLLNLNFLQKQSAAPPVCGRRGSESSIICSIVPSHVNIENVVFYRKKVSYPHGFFAFGQDKSIPSAPAFPHFQKFTPLQSSGKSVTIPPRIQTEGGRRHERMSTAPLSSQSQTRTASEIVLEFVDALEYNGQQYQAFFPAETEGEDEKIRTMDW